MTPTLGPGDFAAEREQLLQTASGLALALARSAGSATSLGRERAILRLIGVEGLDREGRPLAAEVVDRYVDGQPTRLAQGIGLPFAVALMEYETNPQQLALDVAAGSVDLHLEAGLLATPERRAAAVLHLSQLAIAAVNRIDDNRLARAELFEVLHGRRPPWIGTNLVGSSVDLAEHEADGLIRAGFDLVRVEVPTTRELAVRLGELGQNVTWRPQRIGDDPEPTPAGSQRGLARLRKVLDRAAAERGAYVRLAIAPTALAGPEGSIVAAFERADLLDLDPMREMFVTGVDPERALVDFAFAVRVARRAGVVLQLDAGPLVVAPDLDAGVNADPATRSGRALALQMIALLVARAGGMPDAAVIVGALPAWLAGEAEAPARAVAEVALRRALYPNHALAFVEPADLDDRHRWAAIMAAVQPGSGVALVHQRADEDLDGASDAARRARSASDVAAQLVGQSDGSRLAGAARDHAFGTLVAAMATLDLIERDGWTALTGATILPGGWGRFDAEAVSANAVAVDPVEQALER